MRLFATLLLSVSLHGSYRLPLKPPVDTNVAKAPARKGGRWYLADNGQRELLGTSGYQCQGDEWFRLCPGLLVGGHVE